MVYCSYGNSPEKYFSGDFTTLVDYCCCFSSWNCSSRY